MIHPNLLDQLEMFVAAGELGSFSATARKLGRAQNVVSYGISALEENLNVKLFDRSGHKAVLTGAGQALRKEARNIVGASLDLSRKAKELSAGVEEIFSVAVDDMVPFDFFDPAIRAVARDYPGLEVRLIRTAGIDARHLVNSGGAALGIAADIIGLEEKHDFALVGRFQMVPVISPSVQPEAGGGGESELPDLRQIVLSSSDSPEAQPDLGVFSRHIWRVVDLRSKYELIRRGLGWGMLPSDLVEDDLAAGRLIRVATRHFAATPEIPIALFSLVSSPLGPAGQLFRKTIIDQARPDEPNAVPSVAVPGARA